VIALVFVSRRSRCRPLPAVLGLVREVVAGAEVEILAFALRGARAREQLVEGLAAAVFLVAVLLGLAHRDAPLELRPLAASLAVALLLADVRDRRAAAAEERRRREGREE